MFILLPIRINRILKKFPKVTLGLIIVNTIVFLVIFNIALTSQPTLMNLYKTFGFSFNQNAWFTWFTSLFIHGGFLHLAYNMVFLWLFGSALEDALGRVKYILIYLASGLVSCVVHGLITKFFVPGMQAIPLVGASGAIAGLLGLFILRFYKDKIDVFWLFWLIFIVFRGTFSVSSLVGLGAWITIEIFSGVQQIVSGGSGVAHWAHIGGFMFGMVLAKLIKLDVAATEEYQSEEAESLRAGQDYQEAVKHYEKLIGRGNNNAYNYLNAAKAHFHCGSKKLALSRFQRAVELFISAGKSKETLQAYMELLKYYRESSLSIKTELVIATMAIKECQFELALEILNRIIENDPASLQAEQAYLRIGQVYAKMGDKQNAVKIFEDFLNKYPNSEWASYARNWLRDSHALTKS